MTQTSNECIDVHTPHPKGYVQHMGWMEDMMKTHTQKKCKKCGLWKIWVPKTKGELK